MQGLTRRHFLQTTAAALAASGFGCSTRAGQQPPNVLFIAFDDLNDWVNCLGGYPGTVHTPNIDALAASGTLFGNAHCAIPLCNGSRVSTLTGLSPRQTSVYYNSTQWREQPGMAARVTLPQWFRQHGYRAVGAGKVFHFHDKLSWDDYWPDNLHGTPDEPVAADNEHPRKGGPPQSRIDATFDWSAVETPLQQTPDYQVADWVIRQLQSASQQPLFIGCGFGKPHLPWYLPQAYFDRYPLASVQLPAVLQDDLADVPAAGRRLVNEYLHADILRLGHWRKAVQAYLASITFADEQLGRVLAALRQSPRADNTLVVLWSDHGWHLGEKLQWRKLTLWEEATHVPLIVSGPGVPAGQRCDAAVSLLDLYPTVTALARLPEPAGVQGHSLLPLLLHPARAWPHGALTLWQMDGDQYHYALRDSHWRFIRYADGSEELYDHRTDPHEWHNLAGQAAMADRQAAMRAQLQQQSRQQTQARP